MGKTCSRLDDDERRKMEVSKLIDKRAVKDMRSDQVIKKLLLLGAGESGKSTLFKQMITLYGTGFPESERIRRTDTVHNNTLEGIQMLLEQSERMGGDCKYSPDIESSAAYVRGLQHPDSMTAPQDFRIDEMASHHISKLWADPGMQMCFSKRAQYQLPDSTSYFLEPTNLERLSQPEYIPSEQDVLRTRVRTTGIVETQFEIESNTFKMYDVGGQRNERKKWIHCFEGVTALLFVVAISEYDQVLYEDDSMNRMEEAMNLFEETANSRWFTDTAIILFLNKKDLFLEKIQKVPLTACPLWVDYGGPNDYESGCLFVRTEFENICPKKDVYAHITCATDTDQIGHIFNAVKDIIIKLSLRDGGFIVDY